MRIRHEVFPGVQMRVEAVRLRRIVEVERSAADRENQVDRLVEVDALKNLENIWFLELFFFEERKNITAQK